MYTLITYIYITYTSIKLYTVPHQYTPFPKQTTTMSTTIPSTNNTNEDNTIINNNNDEIKIELNVFFFNTQ